MATTLICSPLVIDETAGTATITFSLLTPATGTESFAYDFISLIAYEYAGASGDFTGPTGTLSFAYGETSKSLEFTIVGNATVEAAESFYIALNSPINLVLPNNRIFATIIDNDTLVADTNSSSAIESNEKANLSVRDVVIDEKAGTATFDLILDKATTDTFTVAYSTATTAGTATAGSDFTAAVGSVGFAAGQTVQHVTVNITDDATAEGNEFFNLTLGALSGNAASQVQIADGEGLGLIGRNDSGAVTTPTLTCTPLVDWGLHRAERHLELCAGPYHADRAL